MSSYTCNSLNLVAKQLYSIFGCQRVLVIHKSNGCTFTCTPPPLPSSPLPSSPLPSPPLPSQVGDRVGVMRNPDASLVFFVNGRPQGEAVRDLPRELYGVVDVYGRCCEVRITGGEASSSPAPASGQTPSLPRRPPQVCSSLVLL